MCTWEGQRTVLFQAINEPHDPRVRVSPVVVSAPLPTRSHMETIRLQRSSWSVWDGLRACNSQILFPAEQQLGLHFTALCKQWREEQVKERECSQVTGMENRP